MFPGPGAQVIYNDAGEPLGWDYPSYDEGDSDPYDDFDRAHSRADNAAEERWERLEEMDDDELLHEHEVAEGRDLRWIHDLMNEREIPEPDPANCPRFKTPKPTPNPQPGPPANPDDPF